MNYSYISRRLGFYFLFLGILACTRPPNEILNSSVTLNFPKTSIASSRALGGSVELKTSSEQAFSNKPQFDSSNVPADFDSIDCFAVFVGGPEDILKNKSCYNTDKSHMFQFGLVAGSVQRGQSLTLEVPSGQDRYIRIYGMKRPAANSTAVCPLVDSSGGDSGFAGFSKPYFLGEVGHLQMNPGDSMNIDVPVSRLIDSSKYIEDCQGMGSRTNPSNPGDSGPSGPYLRFDFTTMGSDMATGKYLLTKDFCYPVSPSLYQMSNLNAVPFPNPSTQAIVLSDLNLTGLGQFYSDSNCATTQITSLQIPSGSSKVQAYFKPLFLGDNLTLANIKLTSPEASLSIRFDAEFNKIQIGNKQIVIRGPSRLTAAAGICVPYSLTLERFEGGLTGDATSQNLTLGSNASFYLDVSSSCGSASSVSVNGLGSTPVFFKLMSNVDVDLAAQITHTLYSTKPFVVTHGLGSNIADAVDFFLETSALEVGNCMPGTLRLVNSDRAIATAKTSLEIDFGIPQGQGLLFSDPGCGTPLGQSVPFSAGDFEKKIFLKLTTVLTSLPIRISGSGYKLFGTLPEIESLLILSPIVPSKDPMKLTFFPRSFNGAKIVGTHEFDAGGLFTYQLLPLTHGSLGLLECSDDNSNWHDCSGEMQGDSYKWNASDAAGNISRYVRFGSPGSYRIFVVNRDNLYGPGFSVLSCNGTAGAGAGQTLAAANTALAGSDILCLPANTTYTRSSGTEKFILTTNKTIIGHSSGTSTLDGGNFAGSVINLSSADIGSTGVVVANVGFQNLEASSYNVIDISSPNASSTSQITLANLRMELGSSGSSRRGIWISNSTDADVSIKILDSKFSASGVNDVLIWADSSSRVTVSKMDLSLKHSSQTGIRVNAVGGNLDAIHIQGNFIQGSGIGAYVSLGSTNDLTDFQFIKNIVKLHEDFAAGSVGNYGLRLENKISSPIISNNVFHATLTTPNSYLLGFAGSISSYLVNGATIANNLFIQGLSSAKGIAALNTVGVVDVSHFAHNSLSRIGASGAGVAIYAASSMNLKNLGGTPTDSIGNTVCGAETTNWAAIYSGTFAFQPVGIVLRNPDVSSETGRCKTAN